MAPRIMRGIFLHYAKFLKWGDGMVFDRFVHSEFIYGRMLRGYHVNYLDLIERMIRRTTILVHVTADEKTLLERHDGKGVTPDQIEVVRDDYKKLYNASHLIKFEVDTTEGIDWYDLFREIRDAKSRLIYDPLCPLCKGWILNTDHSHIRSDRSMVHKSCEKGRPKNG